MYKLAADQVKLVLKGPNGIILAAFYHHPLPTTLDLNSASVPRFLTFLACEWVC